MNITEDYEYKFNHYYKMYKQERQISKLWKENFYIMLTASIIQLIIISWIII